MIFLQKKQNKNKKNKQTKNIVINILGLMLIMTSYLVSEAAYDLPYFQHVYFLFSLNWDRAFLEESIPKAE